MFQLKNLICHDIGIGNHIIKSFKANVSSNSQSTTDLVIMTGPPKILLFNSTCKNVTIYIFNLEYTKIFQEDTNKTQDFLLATNCNEKCGQKELLI